MPLSIPCTSMNAWGAIYRAGGGRGLIRINATQLRVRQGFFVTCAADPPAYMSISIREKRVADRSGQPNDAERNAARGWDGAARHHNLLILKAVIAGLGRWCAAASSLVTSIGIPGGLAVDRSRVGCASSGHWSPRAAGRLVSPETGERGSLHRRQIRRFA